MITILSLESLNNKYNIHEWAKYRPFEAHYESYEPHIIYACHKITDVYYAFASARSYISDYECDNFGQLISKHDELHLRYIRSKCLQSALAHYNYAIDLSWQVIWFYLGDNSYLFMERPELYEKYSTLCNEKSLYFKLDICKFDYLKKHIISFFNADSTTKLREIYNYVKHRGSLHTEELGDKFSHYRISYQVGDIKYQPPMITRKSFDLDEFKEAIINFDISFYGYFQQLIKWIIPEDFTDTPFSLLIIPNERMEFYLNEVEQHEKLFLDHIDNFYAKGSSIEKIKQNLQKYL